MTTKSHRGESTASEKKSKTSASATSIMAAEDKIVVSEERTLDEKSEKNFSHCALQTAQNGENKASPRCSSIRNRVVARSSMGKAYYLFSHQVGGHKPFLRSAPGEVCKPAIALELSFYKNLDAKFPQLKPFVPSYHGSIDVNMNLGIHSPPQDKIEQCVSSSLHTSHDCNSSNGNAFNRCDSSSSASSTESGFEKVPSQVVSVVRKDHSGILQDVDGLRALPTQTIRKRRRRESITPRPAEFSVSLWKELEANKTQNPSLPTSFICEYIVLEDLTQGYNRPCVLDIKMGTRQHGDDASPAKKKSHSAKCKATTSFEVGLRLCGMQTFNVRDKQYVLRDKHWGRALKKADIEPALELYLSNGNVLRMEVLELLIHRLILLRNVVKETKGVRFWGASLLLIYEGDDSKAAQEKTPLADVRMIDFAHSNHNCPLQTPDEGYLLGLSNLIRFLNRIQNNPMHREGTDHGVYLDVFPDE